MPGQNIFIIVATRFGEKLLWHRHGGWDGVRLEIAIAKLDPTADTLVTTRNVNLPSILNLWSAVLSWSGPQLNSKKHNV